MTKNQYLKLKRVALDLLIPEMMKEYYCHVQFVVQLSLKLAEELKVDAKTIEIAALFHDIGRGKEVINESHPEGWSQNYQKYYRPIIS